MDKNNLYLVYEWYYHVGNIFVNVESHCLTKDLKAVSSSMEDVRSCT